MNDSDTTIETLKEIVQTFANQRDWAAFHTPKNLAMSIAIEAAEIMEHFQWLRPEESEPDRLSKEKQVEIADECADVLAYLLGLANRLKIDLASALQDKMQRNAEKYPIEIFRGKFGPDDPNLTDYSAQRKPTS